MGVRRDYEEQAKRTITLEFGLEEIADNEKIIIFGEYILM
jgi:FKBP-type peptidyl-prolyl cis-trans isomerase (trigger factor)